MGLLAPSLLLGLIAAAIPYLVHRIGKRTPRPVLFAAMQLLSEAQRRVRARTRIREIALLVLRTAAAAALPFIFSRPFIERETLAPQVSLAPQSAVILLDDSASMRRKIGRLTSWERAIERAQEIVRQLSPESAVALVLATVETPTPAGDLTLEHTRIEAALATTEVSARPVDFSRAIARAQALLANASHNERRIYVITDNQASGWENVDPKPVEGSPTVTVLDVGKTSATDNRAIVGLETIAEPELGPGGIAVTAEVAAWGDSIEGKLPITLFVDGRAVTQGVVELSSDGRGRKKFVHVLPTDGDGAHQVGVEIPADAFPLDDRRITSFMPGQAPRILIVNGDPRTEKTEDETFFLESALQTIGGGVSIDTILLDDVSAELMHNRDVVFVANVATPTNDFARLLIEHVKRGGGLFLSLGEKVSAEQWNLELGPVLPQPIGLQRTASALPGHNASARTGYVAEGELVDDRPAERFAPIDRQHPLLGTFGADGEGLSSTRIYKYFLLEPAPETEHREVILSYETGAPALVERTFPPASAGAHDPGRVLLLSTTLDREWTDLPIRPGFLPLVAESVRRLSGAPSGGETRSVLVGQPRPITIGRKHLRLEIEKPNRQVWIARRGINDPDKKLTFTETDEPGTYRVRASSTDNTLARLPVEDFVVNLDPRESNPTRRNDSAVAANAANDQPAPRYKMPLWHNLGAALILLVLAESVFSLVRRKRLTPV